MACKVLHEIHFDSNQGNCKGAPGNLSSPSPALSLFEQKSCLLVIPHHGGLSLGYGLVQLLLTRAWQDNWGWWRRKRRRGQCGAFSWHAACLPLLLTELHTDALLSSKVTNMQVLNFTKFTNGCSKHFKGDKIMHDKSIIHMIHIKLPGNLSFDWKWSRCFLIKYCIHTVKNSNDTYVNGKLHSVEAMKFMAHTSRQLGS